MSISRGLLKIVNYLCTDMVKNNVYFNSLPNDKILDLSKLKAFADNKINVAQKGYKTLWEKEKMLVTHFLLFPQTPKLHDTGYFSIKNLAPF